MSLYRENTFRDIHPAGSDLFNKTFWNLERGQVAKLTETERNKRIWKDFLKIDLTDGSLVETMLRTASEYIEILNNGRETPRYKERLLLLENIKIMLEEIEEILTYTDSAS